ncbi:hypothetical protein MMC17_004153 [Xylographa soralifera]|nr:hypothetical protein [Xylographa soralifera]
MKRLNSDLVKSAGSKGLNKLDDYFMFDILDESRKMQPGPRSSDFRRFFTIWTFQEIKNDASSLENDSDVFELDIIDPSYMPFEETSSSPSSSNTSITDPTLPDPHRLPLAPRPTPQLPPPRLQDRQQRRPPLQSNLRWPRWGLGDTVTKFVASQLRVPRTKGFCVALDRASDFSLSVWQTFAGCPGLKQTVLLSRLMGLLVLFANAVKRATAGAVLGFSDCDAKGLKVEVTALRSLDVGVGTPGAM